MLEMQSNGQPKALNFEDLKTKLGYKTYIPKIGNVGRAFIAASKTEGNQRSINWVKKQLDILFKKDRINKERKFNGERKK